jgi:hypothetical protein
LLFHPSEIDGTLPVLRRPIRAAFVRRTGGADAGGQLDWHPSAAIVIVAIRLHWPRAKTAVAFLSDIENPKVRPRRGMR